MPLLSTFGAASARSFGGIGAAAAGEVLDIDDVFSTYLWTGTNSANTIANGIDLSGEGGLVWTKWRGITNDHMWVDTERGALKVIDSNNNGAEVTNGNNAPSSFLSNGFTYTDNGSGYDIASWTFRKAPKFFDVVTYSGNSTAGRTVSHNLGSDVGMVIIKKTNASTNWIVWHRSQSSNYGYLNLTNSFASAGAENFFGNGSSTVSPTSTQVTLGANSSVNGSGDTYVMYLFAHNNSDGEFGPDSDQDVIKCGSYTGAGTTDVDVNLGFEPQWVLVKGASAASTQWLMLDNMRGTVTGGNDNRLFANLSNSEAANDYLEFTSTGFRITGSSGDVATSGATYIYMAIRRGPLAEPTSATDVFAVATRDGTEPGFDSSFPVDFALTRTVNTADNWWAASRLNQGQYLQTNSTNAEASASSLQFDYMDGWNSNTGANSNLYSWMWKRAPSYFDVVAWTGTGSDMNISHNLGVVPEMIWARPRSYADHWSVFHKDTTYNLRLNDTSAEGTSSTFGTMTSSVMPVTGGLRASSQNYIAYLFATVAGISKVGSFSFSTGGSSTNVTCGFQPRFILLKKYNGTGNWHMFDTTRGITSGNDDRLELDTTDQSNNGFDWVDLTSDGFTFNDIMGEANSSYIFYAIA